MTNDILVSIIAPMYNSGRYIDMFIDSVKKQTLTNWELIIIDDGSVDDSLSIVKHYCNDDNRIRLFQRNRIPKGSVTCRNIGQNKCKGKYFIHLDTDDILAPFALKQRTDYMEEHPEIDFATAKGKSVTIDDSGIINDTGRKWGYDPKKDILERFLSVNYPFSVWNNIYRSEVFKDYLWDEKVQIYTDFSYIVPSLIKGYRHAFIDNSEEDYFYRIGSQNAMTSNFISGEKYESTKYLFSKMISMISCMDQYSKYKRAFQKFFLLQLERVAINGSQEQVDDYVNYYYSVFSEYKNIRLHLFYQLVLKKCRTKAYTPRLIRAGLYLLYKPTIIFKWILKNN